MKRILSAIVVVAGLLVSLLAAGPVRAQPPMTDTCPHEATVTSLRACVRHAADEGVIDNRGVVNSLLAKLDAAEASAERGQPAVAAAILAAFVREVEAQAGKHIASPHAEHLAMHARMVIEALQ